MAFWCVNATLSSTGTNTLTGFPFQPVGAIITVSSKNGSDGTVNFSEGTCDGTHQSVRSIFQDASGSKSIRSNTKCVSHYERVSGTISEVLAASFSSFTSDGISFNVTTANSNYQINVKAWD